jgi:hypothetical protein
MRTATTMYRAIDLRFWQEQAEATQLARRIGEATMAGQDNLHIVRSCSVRGTLMTRTLSPSD